MLKYDLFVHLYQCIPYFRSKFLKTINRLRMNLRTYWIDILGQTSHKAFYSAINTYDELQQDQ